MFKKKKGRIGMEKFNQKHRDEIQKIFEEKTGIVVKERTQNYGIQRIVIVFGMVCFCILSAFSYRKISSLYGEEIGFESIYKGNGVFEIVVTNDSDKELELQEEVKVMQWSSSKEVEGESREILIDNSKVEAHSKGTITIDLSKGYDIEQLEQPLEAGDWYYFVLTNNGFAFGQDWQCSIDFEKEKEALEQELSVKIEEANKMIEVEIDFDLVLVGEDWIWPTKSEIISNTYGEKANGRFSDHINIAGEVGDEVYAVANGTIKEVGFHAENGYYVELKVDEEFIVEYGHLHEILVKEGEVVGKGKKIGTVGTSGMATGANLSLKVYQEGKTVNPLQK